MRTLILVAILVFSGTAAAVDGRDVRESDLVYLPAYCSGTQLIRKVSRDPKPIKEYVAIYGEPYIHLHHYCGSLDLERKAWAERNKSQRVWKLNNALGGIQYILDRSNPGFVLLPEIYSSQARILFSLDRSGLAIIALQNAIKAKPDYAPAYAQLSDYYAKTNDKEQAIKILEKGIDNIENADALISRLAKLGKRYEGVPGSAQRNRSTQDLTSVEPDDPPTSPANPKQEAVTSEPGNPTAPEEKPNPYCRFCP